MDDEAEHGQVRAQMRATGGRPPRDQRARAAAYLDLWERHLSQAAVHGPEPPARPPE